MPDPKASLAAAQAAGLATPQPSDFIHRGDDAITLNARFTADALADARAAVIEAASKAAAEDGLRPAGDLSVIFGVTDEDGRRTWVEIGPDGRPTPYAAELMAPALTAPVGDALGLAEQSTPVTGLSFAVVDEDGHLTELQLDEAGRFPQHIVDALAARMPAIGGALVAADLHSGPDIAVIGSSSAAGAGGGGTNIHSELSRLSGRTVHPLGVGGEQSPTIAGRFGGRPYLATVAGGAIPASGPVVVTLEADDGSSVTPLLQGNGGLNPVTLAGVAGSITLSGGVYSFTRSTAGTEVATPHRLPVISAAARERRDDIFIFWLGLNDPDTAEADEDVVARTNAMIAHLAPVDKRYLVAGRWAYSPNPRNEGRLLREYGRRYVNVRDLLVRYGLADNGITPTAEDEAAVAAGIVPPSLKYDSAHMNAAGYRTTAAEFHRRLTEMGWI